MHDEGQKVCAYLYLHPAIYDPPGIIKKKNPAKQNLLSFFTAFSPQDLAPAV